MNINSINFSGQSNKKHWYPSTALICCGSVLAGGIIGKISYNKERSYLSSMIDATKLQIEDKLVSRRLGDKEINAYKKCIREARKDAFVKGAKYAGGIAVAGIALKLILKFFD